MELWELLLTIVCLFLALYWLTSQGRKDALPGPRAVPLLGNVLQIGCKPHLKFTEWSKTYGPIFGIKMGMQDAFVVSEEKLMKELLSSHASAGRMLDNAVVHEFTKGPNGVINSEGATWEQQRRFTIKTLKSLGFAKTSMENMIMDEVQTVLELFRNSAENPITGNRLFNAPVVNSLWRLVSGERWVGGESSSKILEAADDLFSSVMRVTYNGLLFAPVLRFIAPEFFGWNQYLKALKNIGLIYEESIEKHRETFDRDNLRDYIDHFLLEMDNETDPDSSFYKRNAYQHLTAGMLDLFIAGSESTSNSLAWAMVYLSRYPEIQEKLHKQIDQQLGSRLPTLQDKNKLPYLDAFISEILRKCSIVPLGIPHRMQEDKYLNGYLLKKNTPFFTNLYGVHHDKDTWGDPEAFRPERFLSKNETKYVRNPALIPFSEGKRMCVGEQFARDTQILFLASILQEFKILPEDSSIAFDFEPELGLVSYPKPFKVILISRKK